MRARIKKTRPALSKGLMRSDIENNTHTHTHRKKSKRYPLTLRTLYAARERVKFQ